jgi:hypothetical protein
MHAIFVSLATADRDQSATEVDVLDPQPKTFHQPHAAAVEQLRDPFHRNCHFREQPVAFLTRQDSR